MDVQKYISSGQLEQYVLGELSPKERLEVERYANQYPAIQKELNSIDAALFQVADVNSIQPKLSELDILDALDDHSTPTQSVSDQAIPPKASPQISLNKTLFWILTSVFLLKGVIIGFLVYQQTQTNQQMNAIHQEIQTLQTDKEAIAIAKQKMELEFWKMRNASKKTLLKGEGIFTNSKVFVYTDEDQQSTFIDIVHLAPINPNQQYQVWAIINGQPTSIGLIENGWKELPSQYLKYVPNAIAYAITIEPKGGSNTPTLDQMVVMGDV